VVASLIASLVVVFLAGFAGVAWKWQDAERQKGIAQTAEKNEAEQRTIAVEEAERSRRLLYASDMLVAEQAWETGDIGRARAILQRHSPQGDQGDLRGFEWYYLWGRCQDASLHTLQGHTGRINSVAFSPDGKTMVTGSDDLRVRIWDIATFTHVEVPVGRIRVGLVSPKDNILALLEQSGKTVHLWDAANRTETAPFTHASTVACGAFSPDGKLLAIGCDDGTVWIWDVKAGNKLSTLKAEDGDAEQVRCIAFSHDGRTLASGGGDLKVRLWDVAARRELPKPLEGHTAFVLSLAFSPDDKTLASGSSDSTVRLWDIAARKLQRKLVGQQTAVVAVAFSPDGKALTAGGGDGTIRVWNPVTYELASLQRGHTAVITALAYAPDGHTLIFGSLDGTIKVWKNQVGADSIIATGHNIWFSSLAFSPDSKTLGVGDYKLWSVMLWDVTSHRLDTFAGGYNGPVRCVTFAPDGQT
jgi:WD40 repeat protein